MIILVKYLIVFVQKILCGYTFEPSTEAVLTSTHNLCFKAKIRKSIQPSFNIKVICKGV